MLESSLFGAVVYRRIVVVGIGRIKGYEFREPEIEVLLGHGVGVDPASGEALYGRQSRNLELVVHPHTGDELFDSFGGGVHQSLDFGRGIGISKSIEPIGHLGQDRFLGARGYLPVLGGFEVQTGIRYKPQAVVQFRRRAVEPVIGLEQVWLQHQGDIVLFHLAYSDCLLELGDKLHIEEFLVSQKLELGVELFGIGQVLPVLVLHALQDKIVQDPVHLAEGVLGVIGLGTEADEQRRLGTAHQYLLGGLFHALLHRATQDGSLGVEDLGIHGGTFELVHLLEELEEDGLIGMIGIAGPDPGLDPGHEDVVLRWIVGSGPAQIGDLVINSFDKILAELLALGQISDAGQDILDQDTVEPHGLHAAQTLALHLGQQGIGLTAQAESIVSILVIDRLALGDDPVKFSDQGLFQRLGGFARRIQHARLG